MYFGSCLGRLEIIKTCVFTKHQIMILHSFCIIVPFWSGFHFGSDLGPVLDPFWHHRGVLFCSHFGQSHLLNHSLTFWIHVGVNFEITKMVQQSIQKQIQQFINKSIQKWCEKHPCSKSAHLPSAPTFVSPLFWTSPRFLVYLTKRSAALRKLRQRFPSSADPSVWAYWVPFAPSLPLLLPTLIH